MAITYAKSKAPQPTSEQLRAQRMTILKRMDEIESTSFGNTNEWYALDERLRNIEAELDARNEKLMEPDGFIDEVPF